MLLIACFLAVCFFRVGLLFFPDAVLGFAFPLLIPGIFDMSWATTETTPTIRMAANNNAHSVMRLLKLNVLGLVMIPSKLFRAKSSLSTERHLQQAKTIWLF